MKKTIILASGNKNKIREIGELLPDYIVKGYKEFFDGEIEETADTFYGNALIKAQTVAKRLNCAALADDSGLCVKALGGAPGVFSARYSGDGVDDHNIELLLKNMRGVKDRSAEFNCSMVFCAENGDILSATGKVKGEITTEKHGENGFGYDPVFFVQKYKKTMAEITAEQKNALSHRGKALKKIIEKIEKYYAEKG